MHCDIAARGRHLAQLEHLRQPRCKLPARAPTRQWSAARKPCIWDLSMCPSVHHNALIPLRLAQQSCLSCTLIAVLDWRSADLVRQCTISGIIPWNVGYPVHYSLASFKVPQHRMPWSHATPTASHHSQYMLLSREANHDKSVPARSTQAQGKSLLGKELEDDASLHYMPLCKCSTANTLLP